MYRILNRRLIYLFVSNLITYLFIKTGANLVVSRTAHRKSMRNIVRCIGRGSRFDPTNRIREKVENQILFTLNRSDNENLNPSFHLTQYLTDHGNFRDCIKKKKNQNNKRWHLHLHWPDHTFLYCGVFCHVRKGDIYSISSGRKNWFDGMDLTDKTKKYVKAVMVAKRKSEEKLNRRSC